MRKLFQIIGLCASLVPLLSQAECIFQPRHSFSIDVHKCNSAIIKSSTAGDVSISGLLVTGTTNNHAYDWEGTTTYDYHNKWVEDGEVTLLVIGNPVKQCNALSQPGLRLVIERMCCDTLPEEGLCIAPVPVARKDHET